MSHLANLWPSVHWLTKGADFPFLRCSFNTWLLLYSTAYCHSHLNSSVVSQSTGVSHPSSLFNCWLPFQGSAQSHTPGKGFWNFAWPRYSIKFQISEGSLIWSLIEMDSPWGQREDGKRDGMTDSGCVSKWRWPTCWLVQVFLLWSLQTLRHRRAHRTPRVDYPNLSLQSLSLDPPLGCYPTLF